MSKKIGNKLNKRRNPVAKSLRTFGHLKLKVIPDKTKLIERNKKYKHNIEDYSWPIIF